MTVPSLMGIMSRDLRKDIRVVSEAQLLPIITAKHFYFSIYDKTMIL